MGKKNKLKKKEKKAAKKFSKKIKKVKQVETLTFKTEIPLFGMGANVTDLLNSERAVVVGKAEYLNLPTQYWIKYNNLEKDNEPVFRWVNANQLVHTQITSFEDEDFD